MKLHLGSGEVYLKGYRNIDFPPSEHSVQKHTKVDEYADILELAYPAASVDEVRLHHVFEHFMRPTAYALLASWWSWLKPGGTLRIEVPDFARTARNALNPLLSKRKRSVALRHIFGSNEAAWAVHYEGWSPGLLSEVVETLGFKVEEVHKTAWKGTFNVEVIATKSAASISKKEFEARARHLLGSYIVDGSSSEQELLQVWMKQYQDQLAETWAK